MGVGQLRPVPFGRSVKAFLEAIPAIHVVVLQAGFVSSKVGNHLREPCFEHERHGVTQIHRVVRGVTGFFEGIVIGTVRQHAVMQADPTGRKTLRLGVVLSVDIPHQLRHDIFVVPGRAERIFLG